MPSFETKRLVQHSINHMFDLVADVENYPLFVPLCDRLTVRGRKIHDDGREIMVADMTVAYKIIRETFTTKVTLDREKSEILVEYLDGPVKELQNRWNFVKISEKETEIVFHLTYEFKSRTFAALMGTVFERAFRTFSEAFEKRANAVYGVSGAFDPPTSQGPL